MIRLNDEQLHNNWIDVKREYECKTTEELFGIESPPDLQCETIDRVVKVVNEIHKDSRYSDNDEEDELQSKLDSINYDVSYLEKDIEEIRTAIEDVRRWGQEWKDLAKKIILEHSIDIDEV